MQLPSFVPAADELRRSRILRSIHPLRSHPVYYGADDQNRLIRDVFENVDPLISCLALYFQACVDNYVHLHAEIANVTREPEPIPRNRIRVREVHSSLEVYEARNLVWAFAARRLGAVPFALATTFIRRMLGECEDNTFDRAGLEALMEENFQQL